ncbi:hypothetical protein [Lysinibacillus sp. RC79]|uniref:hypothetical protein n=1 Tax=Lysinibacillus sp. RC79 TaxID=3156296 RepID=UPI003510ED67
MNHGKIGDVTVNLNFDDKNKLRFRAIAKYFGGLADELDAIDSIDDEDFEKLKAKAVSLGAETKKSSEDIAGSLK